MKHKFILLVYLIFFSSISFATRIKDLVNIKGFRSNPLIGYGLVVGLAGTGDSKASVASIRSATSLMKQLGVQTEENEIVSGSYAEVIVTSELPPFAKNGDRVDVRLSTMADAKSLAGGTLLLTQLKALDHQVYVIAQGAVVVGGASGVGKEVLTVAHAPLAGIVEREFPSNILFQDGLMLSLKKPDFLTNYRIVKKINEHFKGFYASSINPSTIRVEIPPTFRSNSVQFMARMEVLDVEADEKAVIVLNEKTGTVVIGHATTIDPITISHGELSITIQKDSSDEKSPAKVEAITSIKGITVKDLIDALNEMKTKPKDLIDILRTIHQSGALHATIEVL